MREEIKRRIEQIRRGEVPEGYTKIKDGVFPSDWTNQKMKQWISLEERPIILQDEEYYELVTVRRAYGGVDSRGIHQGKDILVKTYFEVEEDDFIISKRQIAHGACGLVPSKLHGAVVSNEYNVFKANQGTNIHFFNLMMQLPHYKRLFYLMSDGVHIEKLLFKTGDWMKRSLAMPPLDEQKKIAEILTAQDKLIALKEKLIEEKNRQKKALMQQLLTGKKRLPGFGGEWSSVLFKECITEVDDRSTESNQHPILSVTKDGIVYQADHFNKQIASDNNIGYKIIKRNQLAFSILNLWMGSVDVLTLCDVGIVSPAYKVFECVEKNLIPSFAKYFLRSYNVIWLYNINSETGASVVRKNLDLAALLNEKLEIPPIDEQGAVAKVLSTADAEIELLQKDLDQEKQKKKALMQLLLTGIVRVTP